MRKLTYYVAVTLDGRISGPDDDFTGFPVTGDHVDFLMREYADTINTSAAEALGIRADRARFDTVLMGWNTYAAAFPFGVRNPYSHLRQYVFAGEGREVAPGIHHVTGDAVETVRQLKAEPEGSGIWLCGGGRLAGSLADEIDELVLKINPLLFGDGPVLFEASYAPRSFRLAESTSYESGVIIARYDRLGA